MAHTEDPPYLTVGTEVSAKYRGAFCEATIKTAKKLVKCKVSYGKGQSALVTSDFIKGPLKVGGQVEVRQPDGQVQAATIAKLTDQSTYTVVFDDGDERTLKRSSLCLKGGRHFHESESLDHLPLTDPENFGTPVMNSSSKKTGRKRRRGSHSPSSVGTPTKRGCSYPSEFPVGKAVFLENDRRRSSWLPAVIVPAHYVLEASDMDPDTICLRSFKDGRFFAATKKELHDFSPDKEPLQSMLEGEIQAMYLCKPAIERAMAYIDTGELPWDMDLFDRSSSGSERPTPSHPLGSDQSMSEDEEVQRHKEEEEESIQAEAKQFQDELRQFHESRGTPMQRTPPTIAQQDLDLFQLYKLVKAIGGMERVTQEMKWRSLYLQLGLPLNSSASSALRQAYRKNLYQFELHEKNKSKGGGGNRRLKPHPPPSSDEEQQQDPPNHQDKARQQDSAKRPKQQDTSAQQEASGDEQGNRGDGGGSKGKVNGLDKGRKVLLSEQKTIKTVKVEKLPLKQVPVKLEEEEEEEEEEPSYTSDSKSEGSDMECASAPSMVESTWSREEMESSLSASSLERGEFGVAEGETEGLEQCAEGYKEGDRVLVLYGKGKTLRTYEAKVKEVERGEGKCDYLVHYNGWNSRYDEWVDSGSGRIAGKITGTSKPSPHFNKRKKTGKSASSSSLFKRSKLPPGTLTSNNQLILSPSLQAIISGHAQPQPKPPKKENSRGHDGISGKSICGKEFSSKTPITLITKNLSPKGLSSRGPISLIPCRPPNERATDRGPSKGGGGPPSDPSSSSSSKERVAEGAETKPDAGSSKAASKGSVTRASSSTESHSKAAGTASSAEPSTKTLTSKSVNSTGKTARRTPEPTARGPSKPSADSTARGPSKPSADTTAKAANSKASSDSKPTKPSASSADKKPSTEKGKGQLKEGLAEPRGSTRLRAGKSVDRSKSKATLDTSSDDTTTTTTTLATPTPAPLPNTDAALSPGATPPSPLPSSPSEGEEEEEEGSNSMESEEDQPTPVQQETSKHWRPPSPPTATLTPPSAPPPSASALICSERFPGGLLPKHGSPSTSMAASALSALAEPAAHSLLSLSVSAGPFPTTPPSTSDPYTEAPPSSHSPSLGSRGGAKRELLSQQDKAGGVAKVESVDSSSTSSGINSMDSLECAEEHKSMDSASDREASPLPSHHHHTPHHTPSKHQLSSSPEGKRKWRAREAESLEDYQRRKKARHAEMNYTLDFSQLPPMSGEERVSLIQQRLREVQQKWSDLKSEVAYIERKRRRAKRKEREAAQCHTHAQPPAPCNPSSTDHSTPSASDSSQLHTTSSVISCH